MTMTVLRYDWKFLSPKQAFELLLQVRQPVADRNFVYVAEAVGADGTVDTEVTFDWFYSKSMERSFVYGDAVTEPSVHALRALRADQPVNGLRLTVRPWVGTGPREPYGECWVSTTATGSHPDAGVWALTKGRRIVEKITQ